MREKKKILSIAIVNADEISRWPLMASLRQNQATEVVDLVFFLNIFIVT